MYVYLTFTHSRQIRVGFVWEGANMLPLNKFCIWPVNYIISSSSYHSHKYELIKVCFISYYYNSYLGSGASNLSSSGNDALVNDTPECG